MFKSNSGESFAGIIVGVFILGFVMLGIVNLLTFSIGSSNDYFQRNHLSNISQNASIIAKKSDMSEITDEEEFFIYKNTGSGSIFILTGATNEQYQYIDEEMNHIPDITTYDGTIYILKGIVYKKNPFGSETDTIIDIRTSIY